MKVTITGKGHIALPAEIVERDQIHPGQRFRVERVREGEYRLVRTRVLPNGGLVDWLLSCPEKGFFVPIDSESTDTL
jgi:AbrB family looped-hinge helix DNA binding protein